MLGVLQCLVLMLVYVMKFFSKTKKYPIVCPHHCSVLGSFNSSFSCVLVLFEIDVYIYIRIFIFIQMFFQIDLAEAISLNSLLDQFQGQPLKKM